MNIEVLLQATVMSAIVSGLFSFFNERRKNKIDCITKEREKWRENLRREIPKIISLCTFEKKIKIKKENKNLFFYMEEVMSTNFLDEEKEVIEKLCFYRLSINPHSKEDEELREYIDKLLEGEEVSRKRFLENASELLKREWEKGKFEASGLKEKSIFVFCFLLFSSFVIILNNGFDIFKEYKLIILLVFNFFAICFLLKYLQKTENELNSNAIRKEMIETNTVSEKNIFVFYFLSLFNFIIIFSNNLEMFEKLNLIFLLNLITIFFLYLYFICKSKTLRILLEFLKEVYAIYLIIIINLVVLLNLAVKDSEPKTSEKTTTQISNFLDINFY